MSNAFEKKLHLIIIWQALLILIPSFVCAQEATDYSVREKNEIAEQLFTEARNLVQQDTIESKRIAFPKLDKACQLFQETKNQQKEIYCLTWLGSAASEIGEKKKALKYFDLSLSLSKQIDDKLSVALNLLSKGLVHSDLTEYQEALDYLERSLPLFKQLDDKYNEASTLVWIGKVYSDLGDHQKSIEVLNQALLLLKQFSDLRSKWAIAMTLHSIIYEFSYIGNISEALKNADQALRLFEEIGDKEGKSGILNNIGKMYFDSGDIQKSLIFYNQSLVLIREAGDKSLEANVLLNIAACYFKLGKKRKVIDFIKQASNIIKQHGDTSDKAPVFINIGALYSDIEEYPNAIESLTQALIQYKTVNDKSGEANAFNQLRHTQELMGNSKLAIFYGKKSVNLYQQLRSDIKSLDKQTQQLFIKKIKVSYQKLSELLITKEKLSEAHQALNAFKDQQFFDFDQTQLKSLAPLSLTVRERNFSNLYEKTTERVGLIGSQIEELKRKIGNSQPNIEETEQLKKLESNFQIASEEFLAILRQAETEFSKPTDEKDKIGAVPDLINMQAALHELSLNTKQKTAAVYQLVGEENFHVLVITEHDIKSVSTPYKNTDLNRKSLDFWALLQSPIYDSNIVGKEVYDVVFEPLEKVLPKDTQTIMWALDANLRYVPMAALWDGKQYLAERYNHVVFTRADAERLTRKVSPVWTGTGFGSSQAVAVDVLGSRISFAALPGVNEELDAIFKKGLVEGKTFPDKQFSKANFFEALRQKRPLVHIASHFSFRAGDEARSFLLLGDSTALTLEEMKRKPNLFQSVELLTLSACNTAAQQAGANGREVDGFAELAQRLGAGAVMATLWSVADCSTPWLMKEFYDLKLNKNLNKAESLRRSQLAFIKGKTDLTPCPMRTDLSPIKIVLTEKSADKKTDSTRSDIIYLDKENAPLWVKEIHPPFAHPYYWSPFILFGNWK